MERQKIRNLHFLKTQVSIRIWEEILLSKLKVTQRSKMRQKWILYIISVLLYVGQPRSQGLRGETVTKTLVKFVLSFQNFGKKIPCAVRLQYGCVALRMQFFSENFGTIKWILLNYHAQAHLVTLNDNWQLFKHLLVIKLTILANKATQLVKMYNDTNYIQGISKKVYTWKIFA